VFERCCNPGSRTWNDGQIRLLAVRLASGQACMRIGLSSGLLDAGRAWELRGVDNGKVVDSPLSVTRRSRDASKPEMEDGGACLLPENQWREHG